MGMAAILIMLPGPVEQTFVSPSYGGSIWNLTLIGPVVSEETMLENVDTHTLYTHTYGRQRPTYPISSPWSLRLRWANKWKMAFIAISLHIFWQRFYRNVSWAFLYQTFLFKPLNLIGCHGNRKVKFAKQYSKIISITLLKKPGSKVCILVETIWMVISRQKYSGQAKFGSYPISAHLIWIL